MNSNLIFFFYVNTVAQSYCAISNPEHHYYYNQVTFHHIYSYIAYKLILDKNSLVKMAQVKMAPL